MSWNFRQNTDNTCSLEVTPGKFVEFGRGVADPDLTYISLINDAGVKTYVYLVGTTVTASTTKP